MQPHNRLNWRLGRDDAANDQCDWTEYHKCESYRLGWHYERGLQEARQLAYMETADYVTFGE